MSRKAARRDNFFRVGLTLICYYSIPYLLLYLSSLLALQISLRDLANKEVRKIEINIKVDDLFYAGTGLLLLRNDEGLHLFDVQQKRIMSSVKANKVTQITTSLTFLTI